MTIEVFELTVAQFTRSLEALKGNLHKGQSFCEAKKIDFSVLMQSRLAPDMYPLVKQIQMVTDNAKLCVSRLTSTTAPKWEDNEVNFQDVLNRMDKALTFLAGFKAEQFIGYEKIKAEFPWYPGFHLNGREYLVQFALPNFYFHLTAAYAILRHCGVNLGKADFLGPLPWIKS
jgi:hypothetical protein